MANRTDEESSEEAEEEEGAGEDEADDERGKLDYVVDVVLEIAGLLG